MNRAQSICLCMIVKDEAPVIARCLDSVRPYISRWLIVDTGSSDATREIVRERLADLPGELAERRWVDFGHNRSEALGLARGRGDYILVIDADETLEADDGFQLPPLQADSYDLEVAYDGVTYLRRQLLRAALPWRYSGVIHEYVECEDASSVGFLQGLRTVVRHDGARSRDPLTYKRDALVLEHALLEDPTNARYAYYLAQSYRDAGDLEAALRAYQRRVDMGGWDEETWFARYQIALVQERLGAPWPDVLNAYLKAYAACPDRAEPLFRIGVHYQAAGEHALAHLFLERAVQISVPGPQRLFVERAMYDYLLPIEHAVAAHYVGDLRAAIAGCNALLRSGLLPAETIGQVVRNRRFSLDARHPAPVAAAVSRLRVVIVAREPGLELAVDSALRQEEPGVDVTVVDDASALHAFITEHCDPEDAVVVLPAATALASRTVAPALAGAFADPACLLVHGPHRLADGRDDGAEPAADELGFEAAAANAGNGAALCFRASLWLEAAHAGAVDAPGLWRTAGFAHTRFVDDAVSAAANQAGTGSA